MSCHPDCTIGVGNDHPGYLGYRCVDESGVPIPFPGEKSPEWLAKYGTWCNLCGDMTDHLTSTCARSVDHLADERADIIARFTAELTKVTGDGSRKRKAGTKPPWYEDDSHEGAVFSHLTKWKRGELVDPDSGCHPLVHAAWRLLAIALIETGNTPNQ